MWINRGSTRVQFWFTINQLGARRVCRSDRSFALIMFNFITDFNLWLMSRWPFHLGGVVNVCHGTFRAVILCIDSGHSRGRFRSRWRMPSQSRVDQLETESLRISWMRPYFEGIHRRTNKVVFFLSYYVSKYDLHLIDFFSFFSFPAIVENCSEGMRNVQILFKT